MKGQYVSDIPKELLLSLYWGNEYEAGQIASIFDCGIMTIFNRLSEYNIQRRIPREPVYFKFSKTQKEIFDGLMLGDGSLEWLGNDCRFTNTDVHEEYLIWLQKQIGAEDISTVKPHYVDGFAYVHDLRTRSIPSIRDEHKRWYPYETRKGTNQNRNNKIIPKDIELTPIKVLFWYIGDGSFDSSSARCQFCNFLVLDDVLMLLNKLYILFNVSDGLYRSNHPNSQCYSIRLNRIVSKKLFSMVKDLNFDVPKCYWYKFGIQKSDYDKYDTFMEALDAYYG